jgi:hypothetical protein
MLPFLAPDASESIFLGVYYYEACVNMKGNTASGGDALRHRTVSALNFEENFFPSEIRTRAAL